MRKYALVRFLAFHVSTLMLLLLLGTVAHRSIRPAPAVLLFEPSSQAPRLPGAHVETEVESSPLPAPRERAPKLLKRRSFLPPMVA